MDLTSSDANRFDTLVTERRATVSPPQTARLALVRNSSPGLTVARGTHVGQIRQRNEDSDLVIGSSYCGGGELVALTLLIVADGMGGHESGDVASLLATRVAAAHIVQDVFLPLLAGEERGSQQRPLTETLVKSVEVANDAVYRQVPQAGTTLTVALVFGDKVYVAHVGDCRAYVLNDTGLECITQDHSVVARLIQTGHARPEDTLAHTHRNILYRAVGQTDTVEVDTYMRHFPVGSCLLLCSDGLWGKVTEAELAELLAQAPGAQAAVDTLLRIANERGGEDNITVLLAVHNVAQFAGHRV